MSTHEKENRYVAYFDMLGFKTATRRNPTKAWQALKSLRESMDKILRLGVYLTERKIYIKNPVQLFILADSVLMFTFKDTADDLTAILGLSSELHTQALHRCVAIRGGVAHGEFFYNLEQHLFGGEPFVRAYELEKCAQWSGIVVDESVATHYKNSPTSLKCPDESPVIIPWNVRLKNGGTQEINVLNWVEPHRQNFNKNPPISVPDFYLGFTGLFGSFDTLDRDAQSKYENTVEFINYCLTRR